MSLSAISATIASVALVFLILGFVVGWVRGYQKSLTRFIIVLVVAVVAFFITPVITEAVLDFNLAKYGVEVNGQAVATVEDYLIAQISQVGEIAELMESSATLRAFVTALPAMLVNVVLFTVLFFLLKWISMLIYWIFAGIFFNKKKLEGKSKVKLVGAGVGTLQALIALAILLVPLFGFANIINTVQNEFDQANSTSTAVVANAAAVSDTAPSENENEDIQIEETVNEVSTYVGAFENTWVVKVYSAFGIDKLSVSVFNELSKQEVNNVTTNLTTELSAVAKILPYAQNLLNGGSEINTGFVNNVDRIIDSAFSSPVLENIVSEVISSASAKWANGETFLGLEMPKIENNEGINNVISNVFNSLQNSTVATIRTDTDAIVSVLRILTEDDIISAMNSGNTSDILNALSNENKNTISDLVGAMLVSNTLKDVLPDILNVGLDYVYDALEIEVPAGQESSYKITVSADEVNWNTETAKIQTILGNIARVYADYDINYVQANQGKPESEQVSLIEVIDFAKIGQALDSMKTSQLFGGPSQKIFESLLDNEMLSGIIPEATRTELKQNWANINMEATFTSLNEMVNLAIKLSDSTQSIAKDDIANVLETIVSDGVSSGVIESILSPDNLQSAGLDETTANSVSEVVSEITSSLAGKPEQEKQNEINGIATVVEIISKTQLSDETVVIENTDETIESIANSTIITGLIESSSSVIGGLDLSNKIDETSKTNLETSINNNQTLTQTQKEALLGLLVGISG